MAEELSPFSFGRVDTCRLVQWALLCCPGYEQDSAEEHRDGFGDEPELSDVGENCATSNEHQYSDNDTPDPVDSADVLVHKFSLG